MKKMKFFKVVIIISLLINCAFINLNAQVTIGDNKAPENFSVLELISNNKSGLRLPQIETTAERDAISDAYGSNTEMRGLTIFNKETYCVNVWNGTTWIEWCAQQSVPLLTTTPAITEVNDDVPDCTGTVADGGWTNDAAPTVKGTLDAALGNGETVVIYRSDNGGAAVKLPGVATVTNTDWTYDDSGLLSGHTYAYTAKVVSSGGGESVFSNAWSIQVDTDRPTQIATIDTYTDDQEPQTGVFDFSIPTNDQTPLISGTLSSALGANETLVLYRAAGAAAAVKVATLTVGGNLKWTYQETPPLPDAGNATYTYTARVEDAACNYGDYSAPAALRLDTRAPFSPSIANVVDNVTDAYYRLKGPTPEGYGSCNDPTPTITGGESEPGTTVLIYDNGVLIGTTTADNYGNWTMLPSQYLVPGLTDGWKILTAKLVDAAGNISAASQPFTFTQDTTPPTQLVTMVDFVDAVGPIQGVRQSGEQTDDPQPTLRGTIVNSSGQPATLATGERVTIYWTPISGNYLGFATIDPGGTSWTFRIPANLALTNNSTNDFSALVVDAAGNAGPLSGSVIRIIVKLSGGY